MSFFVEVRRLEGHAHSAIPVVAMAERGVDHDPTLVAVEGLFFGNDPRITENPLLELLPERVRADWHIPGGLIASVRFVGRD